MKIIIHYKLNNYDTKDNRIDTSAYCSILALTCKEVYYTADSDSENKDININNFEDEDINVGDFEDKDVGINNFENKDVGEDNFENEDIGIDNSVGENDLDWDNNINQ